MKNKPGVLVKIPREKVEAAYKKGKTIQMAALILRTSPPVVVRLMAEYGIKASDHRRAWRKNPEWTDY